MRRVSGFTVMLATLVAILVAVVVLLGLSLLTTHSSTTRANTFSLPAELPTAPVNASNPYGCGANHTDFFSLPAHASLYYSISVNASDGRVNFGVVGANATTPARAVLYGTESRGDVRLADSGATIQFLFQGCGSTRTVPLGFWGNFTLPSSA